MRLVDEEVGVPQVRDRDVALFHPFESTAAPMNVSVADAILSQHTGLVLLIEGLAYKHPQLFSYLQF